MCKLIGDLPKRKIRKEKKNVLLTLPFLANIARSFSQLYFQFFNLIEKSSIINHTHSHYPCFSGGIRTRDLSITAMRFRTSINSSTNVLNYLSSLV